MKTKLSAVSLGMAFGVAKAIWMIAFAWVAWHWGFGSAFIRELATIYHNYDATLFGGLWGGLWGFIEGFLFGLVVGWVYNICMCCARPSDRL
jgi:membrane protease YdiL (CAAX protease family)